MTKPTDHTAKTPTTSPVGTAAALGKGIPPNAGTSASPPLPKSWKEIGVGSLVIANEGVDLGWWEAVVTDVRDDILTLRWRDYPKQAAVARNRKEVALLFSGN